MPYEQISDRIRAGVPSRGMPLGWRLALYTAAIVTVVMGSVTVFQEQKTTQYERQQIDAGLRSTLLPLAARIESATDLPEMAHDLRVFHEAFIGNGVTNHHVALHTADGQPITSTRPLSTMHSAEQLTNLNRVDLIVTNPLFTKNTAVLSVYQDESAFNAHRRSRIYRALFHFTATLGSILLGLQFAIRALVTTPLNRLLEGIRKTEMGYWGEIKNPSGAWEIRWIIWRFQNMGSELEQTVEHLLAAERRAKTSVKPSDHPQKIAANGSVVAGAHSQPPHTSHAQAAASLVEICHRLEAVKTPTSTDRALASEVALRYAYEAEELGDISLKSQMENASLRVLEPATYHDIESRLIDYTNRQRDALLACQNQLQNALETNMIPVVDLQARSKHIAGISAKMLAKGLEFEQIHDLFALRVVVPSEADCYWTLGVVHETFAPVVGRFKDYIATPKNNGYRSIHTCVKAAADLVVEVQIRSLTMHRSAEYGATSHLKYKKSPTPTRELSL